MDSNGCSAWAGPPLTLAGLLLPLFAAALGASRPTLLHRLHSCYHRWRDVKFAKKAALAKHIKEVTGYEVSTQPLFDVQVRLRRG